ncbi:S4 domain-containing protein [Thiospirillum jenense]|uniref:S4 domain-containing protein n=1 Tax=Thiospirillum jenense TaxID=1653858 RepID=UPI0030B80701
MTSTSEALRMIKQGAVKLDGKRVSDAQLVLKTGNTAVVQVGKRRAARVSVGEPE